MSFYLLGISDKGALVEVRTSDLYFIETDNLSFIDIIDSKWCLIKLIGIDNITCEE